MVNLEESMYKSKDFIEKLLDIGMDIQGRKFIDRLDFEVISTNRNDESFIIDCSMLQNLYGSERKLYRVYVNRETGEVTDFKRLDENKKEY